MNKNLVIDVGLFDGSDTAYYLARGYHVVAVEANPLYVEQAKQTFAREVSEGRLKILHCGVAAQPGSVEFFVCAEDPGSSSFVREHLKGRSVSQTLAVPCIPFSRILAEQGVPFYVKVDIESSDALCIQALQGNDLPAYVSFEAGDDALDLLRLLSERGYSGFKIINQLNYRELAYIGTFQHRLSEKIRTLRGKPEPETIRRGGWNFRAGFCAGPMAEETDGSWRTYENASRTWAGYTQRYAPLQRYGWYDIHARLGGTS